MRKQRSESNSLQQNSRYQQKKKYHLLCDELKDHEEQEDMEISEKEETQLATFVLHCGKHTVYKEQKVADIRHMWDDYVCPKYVPTDTDLDYGFNCFKCSA